MLKSKKTKIFFFLLFIFLFSGVDFIFAQKPLEVNYPDVFGQRLGINASISEYVRYIFNLIIWIVGAVALGVFIAGGIRYLLSSGKPEAIIAARQQIYGAFLGILILLSSYLVFKTINPQLLILNIPTLETIKTILRPTNIPSPPSQELRTSISSDIPFGKLIKERLFETQVPRGQQGKPRMERIKDIASNKTKETPGILEISEKLRQQSEQLVQASNQCKCGDAEPCCEADNPGKGCKDNSCSSKRGCTCDPCKKPRLLIQQLERKNLDEVRKLVEEQKKADDEIRLLREEIGKLERAKKFISDCNDWVRSLADYLVEKGYFTAEEMPFRTVNFWNYILIRDDWASFYCPVSGTTMGTGEYITSLQPLPAQPSQPGVPPGMPPGSPISTGEPDSCVIEMPVGEIIDRSIKTGYKLVERLERLINVTEKMINAVDYLHVLVSQCSSQRCMSVCYKFRNVCIKACTGNPCPDAEIDQQLQKIIDILEGVPNGQSGNTAKQEEGIRDVVNGPQKSNPNRDERLREQIGINTIIDQIVPLILSDLETSVKERMKACVSDIPTDITDEEAAFEETQTLSNCRSAVQGIGPGGTVILSCCMEEPEFKQCLTDCYLEKGEQKYKQCLQKCLTEKAKNLPQDKAEIIRNCRNNLNFYCCRS